MTEPTLHCTHCGARHAVAGWPKRCGACGRTTWKNPTPVAVALVPVESSELGPGLLAVRRAIEPGLGKLALPGGFIDLGETWQAAIAREVREETGLVVDPERVDLFTVHSPPSGDVVLIFGLTASVDLEALPDFTTRTEASERTVVRAPTEMAFPLHSLAVEDYFLRL